MFTRTQLFENKESRKKKRKTINVIIRHTYSYSIALLFKLMVCELKIILVLFQDRLRNKYLIDE